jgi:hypothetical protein
MMAMISASADSASVKDRGLYQGDKMKDHPKKYRRSGNLPGTFSALPEHQDRVNQTHSVQDGRNSKPKQWHIQNALTNLSQCTEHGTRASLIIQTKGFVLSVTVTMKRDSRHNKSQ